MSTGTGVNVSKANTYAVADSQVGTTVSKANVYAVIVSVPPGVNVTKALVYAAVGGGLSTVNKIEGGGFVDSVGNPLAHGYLVFELSKAATVNNTTQICDGYSITIPLDANGVAITSPSYYLWPNDALTPSNTFYLVSAYTAKGQLVWGPNPQLITTNPSPFNISSWVPGKIF